MKRALYILSGTGVGLAGILAFQSTPIQVKMGTTQTQLSAPSTAAKTPTTTAGVAVSSTIANSQPATTTGSAATTSTASAAPSSAIGPPVNYYFGNISVSVTALGHKITSVTIANINDGGNGRSMAIDQYAVSILEKQALAAQSANIQGVTGASYTSAGFKQSLQGALQKLGI